MDLQRCCDVLGVQRDVTLAEVHKAFRRLALKRHPDKIGPSGHALMQELNAAYEYFQDFWTRLGNTSSVERKAESQDPQRGTAHQPPKPQSHEKFTNTWKASSTAEKSNFRLNTTSYRQQRNESYEKEIFNNAKNTSMQKPEDNSNYQSKPWNHDKTETKFEEEKARFTAPDHDHSRHSEPGQPAHSGPFASRRENAYQEAPQHVPQEEAQRAQEFTTPFPDPKPHFLRGPICDDKRLPPLRIWIQQWADRYLDNYIFEEVNIHYRKLGAPYIGIFKPQGYALEGVYGKLEWEAGLSLHLILYPPSNSFYSHGCPEPNSFYSSEARKADIQLGRRIGMLLNAMKWIQAINLYARNEHAASATWLELNMEGVLDKVGSHLHTTRNCSNCDELSRFFFTGWVEADRRWRQAFGLPQETIGYNRYNY